MAKRTFIPREELLKKITQEAIQKVFKEGVTIDHTMVLSILRGDELAIASSKAMNFNTNLYELDRAFQAHQGKRKVSFDGIKALTSIPVRAN